MEKGQEMIGCKTDPLAFRPKPLYKPLMNYL